MLLYELDGVGWGWGGVGWGNTNPTSCYASGSLSTLLHERLATLVDLCLRYYEVDATLLDLR